MYIAFGDINRKVIMTFMRFLIFCRKVFPLLWEVQILTKCAIMYTAFGDNHIKIITSMTYLRFRRKVLLFLWDPHMAQILTKCAI